MQNKPFKLSNPQLRAPLACPSIFMQSKPLRLGNPQLRAPLACPSIFMQSNTLESRYSSQTKHYKKM